jgi:Na+/proline symporter
MISDSTPSVIVTAMLILGGAATVTALCGMNVYAASFLIPLSAVPFTMHGAIQSSQSSCSQTF